MSSNPPHAEMTDACVRYEWNATDRAFASDTCLHTLIEQQVERTPEAVAVVFEDVRLSYRNLNEQANRLAHFLRCCGVGPDAVVGLHMGRSIELMVAVLAVLKAGAAYLPLDPQYPGERLDYMACDAAVQMLLQQAGATPLAGHPMVVFDPERWAEHSSANPEALAGPLDLAYILYTSGSTGLPKGVEVSHRSVVNFVQSMAELLDFSAREMVVSVTGLTFDIAGLDLYLTWTHGATLILVPRATVFDGPKLAQAVQGCQATFLQTTPVTWRSMLEGGWTAPPGFKALCGGEALPRPLFDALLAQPLRLWNLYGPTETTIWSTAGEMQAGLLPITVGRPIWNTRVYILDERLEPVPLGTTGEVYIAGAGLARGYRNRADLTAEKFLPDRLAGSGRMYRTGDLGRFLPDGDLELLGRQDHQIKWHGYRIEPGEVEAAVLQVTGVSDCLVTVREVDGDASLVAYLLTEHRWRLSDLVAELSQRLPNYMVPAHVVCLSHWPQTPNGKVDRQALPGPSPAADLEGRP